MSRRLFAFAPGLAADARGLALVEFATVLPVLLVLYLGGFQLSDGIACSRKVTITTRAMADLVAQNVSGTTSAAEVDNDLAAATQVMAPYPAADAMIRVSEVGTNASGVTTVQWSRAINGGALLKNATITIPTNFRIPGSYFLLAEVSYGYKPPVSYQFIGNLTLSDSIYMLPRNTNKIDCSDC